MFIPTFLLLLFTVEPYLFQYLIVFLFKNSERIRTLLTQLLSQSVSHRKVETTGWDVLKPPPIPS